MSDRKVIRVSPESRECIDEVSETLGIEASEAVDKLIAFGYSRFHALRGYAARQKSKRSKAKKLSR